MIVSNLLGEGIQFAEFSTLIPKSLLLVHLANLVGLIPIAGGYVAFLVWFIGAMVFFHLDVWESRFLVLINGLGNFVVKMFLLSIFLNLLMSVGKDIENDIEHHRNQPPALQQELDIGD
jgi:hypothetical protein